MMTIRVWDYKREYKALRDEILEMVDQVFGSGRLILGERVANFEKGFSSYCGAGHGLGVNSGTDALFLALKALGIGDDDEVITVANTAVPTVASIVSTGARPIFVDISPETYLLDVNLLEDAIGPKTKCILPVHLYGQCADMQSICRIAETRGLAVLEDCAQSTGAGQGGRRAGCLGDIGAFSFYPTKVLGGYGDGGMVVTDDPVLYDKLNRLRQYGMDGAYYAEEHGYNSRLDEVQAGILSLKLKHVENWIERRRSLASAYDKRLQGVGIVLPREIPGNRHVYYLYVVRHSDRDHIIEDLRSRDIHCNISYPFPIHTMRGYAGLGYREGDLPVTEAAAREIFSLPLFPTLTDAEQELVCSTLEDILS